MTKIFGDWLKDWLNVYKKPYVKNWKPIQRCIFLHIPEHVRKIPLQRLTAFDIQKALLSVSSSRMRVETFDIYHGSLTTAFKVGLIEKDIAAALIKPKHVRKVGSALTRSEVSEFISVIERHRLKNYYTFCLLTGCRRSEALAVLWSDIDLEKINYISPALKRIYQIDTFRFTRNLKNC